VAAPLKTLLPKALMDGRAKVSDTASVVPVEDVRLETERSFSGSEFLKNVDQPVVCKVVEDS